MNTNQPESGDSARALPSSEDSAPRSAHERSESPSERAEEDEPDELQAGELRREVEDLTDRYLRLAAEFENFKRRRSLERADALRYSSEEAARTLLPVLDNLRRAVDHAADTGSEDILNGLQLVVREFESALERLGITPVQTVGEAFDPSVHEAIGGEESDEVEQDTVVAEIQPGYRLHDRLIRPALVRVAHPRRPLPSV